MPRKHAVRRIRNGADGLNAVEPAIANQVFQVREVGQVRVGKSRQAGPNRLSREIAQPRGAILDKRSAVAQQLHPQAEIVGRQQQGRFEQRHGLLPFSHLGERVRPLGQPLRLLFERGGVAGGGVALRQDLPRQFVEDQRPESASGSDGGRIVRRRPAASWHVSANCTANLPLASRETAYSPSTSSGVGRSSGADPVNAVSRPMARASAISITATLGNCVRPASNSRA